MYSCRFSNWHALLRSPQSAYGWCYRRTLLRALHDCCAASSSRPFVDVRNVGDGANHIWTHTSPQCRSRIAKPHTPHVGMWTHFFLFRPSSCFSSSPASEQLLLIYATMTTVRPNCIRFFFSVLFMWFCVSSFILVASSNTLSNKICARSSPHPARCVCGICFTTAGNVIFVWANLIPFRARAT